MRYKAAPTAGHSCCFRASVIDTEAPEDESTVCECYTLEAAQVIADSLNVTEPQDPGATHH